MAGITNGTGTAVTRHRRTHVILDPTEYVVVEPALVHARAFGEMARHTSSEVVDATCQVDGWRLRNKVLDAFTLHELGDVDDRVLAGTVGGNLVQMPMYRPNTDLTGVTAGSTRAGDQFYSVNPAAGASFATELTADATAFPGPTDFEDTQPCGRQYISHHTMSPGDVLLFRLRFPGTWLGTRKRLGTIYFTGVPGQDRYLDGDGSYALSAFGDGSFWLHERGKVGGAGLATWLRRYMFQAAIAPTSPALVIVIQSDASFDGVRWKGKQLIFRVFAGNERSGAY